MDLNLLILARQNGEDQSVLPGLHIASQPRRSARGRRQDRLVLHFVLEGNAPLSPDGQRQLLVRLAEKYYKTPGSVTAALRTVAESLSQYLLNRNLRAVSSGRQGLGLLSMITVRDGRLYLAQCGPTNAYLISASGVLHFHDPSPTSRGLGIGRTTPIHYSQASFKPDETLLLTTHPDPTWSTVILSGLHSQEPDIIHQRLLSQAGPDINAVLIQAKSGPGKTQLLPPKELIGVTASRSTVEEQSMEETAPAPEPTAPAEITPEPQPFPPEIPAVTPTPEVSARPTEDSSEDLPVESPDQIVEPQPSSPPISSLKASPILGALTATGRTLRTALGQSLHSMRSFLLRMLPGEGIFSLPPSVMFLIAIAVPLVVVTIATVVYFQRGRAGQYDSYYAQAVQSAGYARAQSEPLPEQEAWDGVLVYLDQAEAHQITPESQNLRGEAQQALDRLNKVIRLEFQPAIVGDLPNSSFITRIVATTSDLYLLDTNDGHVQRAFDTGQGYKLDNTYQCGPGLPGSQGIGPLIDILVSPKEPDRGVTILGIDAAGSLLECHAGESPTFTALATPSTGWGQPHAFSTDLGHLYVLDPPANAVWIYWNSDFTQQPQLFFDEEVPPMQEAIDLVVDKGNLYILHSDGHITICTFSDLDVSPTRCTDPAPYTDSRPGRDGQSLYPYPLFSQIQSTQPPDPSLYLLDPSLQAIYHFSLRLTYQRQLRPQINLASVVSTATEPTSAFAISPNNRIAFMALGNQVIYAGMP